MAGVGSPELAAAVANAGGLGALGLGATSHNIPLIRANMQRVRQLTGGSASNNNNKYQVNLFCHAPAAAVGARNVEEEHRWIDHLRPHFEAAKPLSTPKSLGIPYPSFVEDGGATLEAILAERPDAVSFHFGLPRADQLAALKSAGFVTIASATCAAEAVAAVAAGIDIIVAQGVSAGGHRGMFDPSADPNIDTADLVKLLRSTPAIGDTPIVAAGGITNGEEAAAMLALGAAAVQIGTAFIPCPESSASGAYRDALRNTEATAITSAISGRPARCLVNKWHSVGGEPAEYPAAYMIGKELAAVSAAAGNAFSFGAFFAGSGHRKIHASTPVPAEELVRRFFPQGPIDVIN